MSEITVVVLADPAHPALGGIVASAPGVRFKIGKTAESLEPELREARVLFNWQGGQREIRHVMAAAPKLEWIHVRYAGLDKLLFPELIASPVPLTNGSGVFSESLGEFVMLGVLYFAKDVPRLIQAKAERRWESFSVHEIGRETMGIVGHGSIGRAAARRAKAMGMRVLALRRHIAPRPGDEDVDRLYRSTGLHAMLPECDYVVVTAPLTPETHRMIGTPEFALMKPGAIVMNVGRGPVIDESTMVEALRAKQIRGAALDVFEVEPLPAASPLWSMDNVLISPHTADHTKNWDEDAVNFFLEQFARWRAGSPLENIVDKRAGY